MLFLTFQMTWVSYLNRKSSKRHGHFALCQIAPLTKASRPLVLEVMRVPRSYCVINTLRKFLHDVVRMCVSRNVLPCWPPCSMNTSSHRIRHALINLVQELSRANYFSFTEDTEQILLKYTSYNLSTLGSQFYGAICDLERSGVYTSELWTETWIKRKRETNCNESL